jgi:hypothetical protein
MLIIFFDIKGTLHKTLVLASETIPHTTVKCLKMCGDLAPNWGDKRSGCCITTSHRLAFLFARKFMTKNNTTVVLQPPYFSVSPIKMKLKGRHFDTTEVMEAESQAVLITLTEQDFQDAFRKWQTRWKRCICAEGHYFEGDGGQ